MRPEKNKPPHSTISCAMGSCSHVAHTMCVLSKFASIHTALRVSTSLSTFMWSLEIVSCAQLLLYTSLRHAAHIISNILYRTHTVHNGRDENCTPYNKDNERHAVMAKSIYFHFPDSLECSLEHKRHTLIYKHSPFYGSTLISMNGAWL